MGVDESSGRYRHLVSRLAERLKEEDKIRRSLKVRVLRSLEWNIDVHLTPGMVLGVGHRERKLALRLLTNFFFRAHRTNNLAKNNRKGRAV